MKKKTICFVGHQSGKAALMEKALNKFTIENPDAVIARLSHGEVRIEKPIQGEIIETKRIK